MIAWSSLPASFIISSLCLFSPPSLSLLQLNELFRKSEVHKDFMSVRVRNLAPSNSILAFVEAHFKPGERSLKRKKRNNYKEANREIYCMCLESLQQGGYIENYLPDLNETGIKVRQSAKEAQISFLLQNQPLYCHFKALYIFTFTD